VSLALAGVLELVADECRDFLERAVGEDDDPVGVDARFVVHLLQQRMQLLA
jgi:hypothetical protein